MVRIKFLLFCGLILILFVVSANAQPKKLPRAEENPSEKKVTPINNISSVPLFSDPVGADVYLNDKLLGKTTVEGKLILGKNKPKTLTLKAGKYKFRFEHPDYQSDLKEITFNNGESKPVTGMLKPKFGFLLLANLPRQATLLLDGKTIEEKNFFWQDDGNLKLKTSLGEHELKVILKGYQTFTSQHQIKDATPIAVGIELKKLLASLIVKSNPGARVYLDNEEKGTIATDGKLVLNELVPEKDYQLAIEREGYKKFEAKVNLVLEKENAVEQILSLLPNSGEFVDNFDSLVFWNAPKEWQAKNGFLQVNSKEVGLPKERNYCNAKVVFGLRLINSRGAAWVVRAQDKESYYLFSLNGSEGAYPNKFVTYVCRKGKYDLTQPVIIPISIPVELKPNQTYRIQIIITDNLIEHTLIDNQTGKEFSIGLFRDEKNLYPCGNVGFVAPSGEDFQAYGFVIKPNE